jgi:pyruvate dehydrogenase E2 component (dihydrolipoamide acetyltransferase)
MKSFKIPELGENIQSATVIKVLVAVGDVVELDQPVLELETDKATIEVPSDVAGKVTEVLVADGSQVTIGQEVLRVEELANVVREEVKEEVKQVKEEVKEVSEVKEE